MTDWDALAANCSYDDFLGGRVRAWQPKQGFRAGIDAVLLAACVPAEPGQSVLELGCGAAVASLCLATRVPELRLVGVEIQAEYTALAVENANIAAIPLQVVTADLRDLPAELREQSFDHVLMNPPYFRREGGSRASDDGRELARGGDTALEDWINVAVRRLAPGGVLSVIQRIERLPELLCQLDARMGAVQVLPLVPRRRQPATLALVRARKGRRTPFALLSPLVLHSGARHADADDGYTPEIEAALRGGEALAGFTD